MTTKKIEKLQPGIYVRLEPATLKEVKRIAKQIKSTISDVARVAISAGVYHRDVIATIIATASNCGGGRPKKPSDCPRCGEHFPSQQEFFAHRRKVHKGMKGVKPGEKRAAKPTHCKKCNITFPKKGEFTIHLCKPPQRRQKIEK